MKYEADTGNVIGANFDWATIIDWLIASLPAILAAIKLLLLFATESPVTFGDSLKMAIIPPTVGRVVWFYPSGHKEGDQPLAALVAHVWSDTCVNLAIFDANGSPALNPPTSVLLIQEGAEKPTGGNYCAWMPYQLGQAKKHTEAK